jgi:hypothetical protein
MWPSDWREAKSTHLCNICNLRFNPNVKEHCIKSTKGRAVAQAVSRWIPTAAARVRVRAEHVGFVVDEVALDQVFPEYFGFNCQSSFHQFLHHHNHSGLAQQAYCWPQCRVDPIWLHPPLYQFKKKKEHRKKLFKPSVRQFKTFYFFITFDFILAKCNVIIIRKLHPL